MYLILKGNVQVVKASDLNLPVAKRQGTEISLKIAKMMVNKTALIIDEENISPVK